VSPRHPNLSLWIAGGLWLVASCELILLALYGIRGRLGEVLLLGPLFSDAVGPERASPLAVLVVLAAVAGAVAVRSRAVWREERALEGLSASELPTDVGDESLQVSRRLRLLASPGTPEVLRETLPAASTLDAVALGQRYRTLKAFVWTLPVLGFIGTAWGMVGAIGGFSAALQAARSPAGEAQLQILTQRLSLEVIPSLTGAFSVTILALGATVLAHFWVTVVEGWEQRTLHRLDEICLGHFSAALAGVDAARDESPVRALTALTREIQVLSRCWDLDEVSADLASAAAAQKAAAEEVAAAAAELAAAAAAPYQVTIARGPRP
jgi:hypothetical protein